MQQIIELMSFHANSIALFTSGMLVGAIGFWYTSRDRLARGHIYEMLRDKLRELPIEPDTKRGFYLFGIHWVEKREQVSEVESDIIE